MKRKDIAEIIPKQALDFYITTFKKMRALYNSETPRLLYKEYQQISNILIGLVKSGLLLEKDFLEINEVLGEKLIINNISSEMPYNLIVRITKDGKPKKAGKNRDFPLAFIMFALDYDVRHYEGRSRFMDVISFLQNKLGIDRDEYKLRQDLGKLNFNLIAKDLIFFTDYDKAVMKELVFMPKAALSPFIEQFLKVYVVHRTKKRPQLTDHERATIMEQFKQVLSKKKILPQ